MNETPTELRAPQGARWMEIDWSDGASTRYAHLTLRALCPCAHCQGHQGPIKWQPAAETASLELTGIDEVGNYALRLTWGDGHGSGIYSFRYLRELGPLAEMTEQEIKGMRFGR